MNYGQALRYLEARKFAVSKLGLERIRHLLKELGSPEKGLKVVHVTGTNGKGSVTTMVSSILVCAGYKTGTYISPHLTDFRERIAVGGKMISGKDFAGLMDEIKPVADRMEKGGNTFRCGGSFGKRASLVSAANASAGLLCGGNAAAETGGRPTYFELATAAAFLHFRKEDVDVAVVEVGLGGRLDATNVCEDTMVAVITNVSLEHTKCLGDSESSIAKEKAEIIKKGSSVVTAAAGDALAVIGRKCGELSCPLCVIGRDAAYSKVSSDVSGTRFAVSSAGGNYGLSTPMPGDHQMENAACAVATAELLGKMGLRIGKDAIVSGISAAVIGGRFEVTGKSPLIVLDGAHNPAGIRTTRKTFEDVFPRRKAVAVLSACTDKDIPAMVKTIAPVASMIIATRHSMKERVAEPEALAVEARRHCGSVEVVNDVKDALSRAVSAAGKDGIVLVAGSLYLVGDVKKLL